MFVQEFLNSFTGEFVLVAIALFVLLASVTWAHRDS